MIVVESLARNVTTQAENFMFDLLVSLHGAVALGTTT